jgi:periplasmic divalent cation tolerance protein
MYIAWTTVSKQEEAESMAREAIGRGLAACVEITAVVSHYRWKGALERAGELRLGFKCLPAQLAPLEAFVLGSHPYDVPEWIVIRAERVSEKYLSWAEASSTRQTL